MTVCDLLSGEGFSRTPDDQVRANGSACVRQRVLQIRRMSELCNWYNFQAHQRRFDPEEETRPDFFGTFICPVSRKEPEQLLEEVLTIRKVFLVQITDERKVKRDAFWGMSERLKQQIDEMGYGISLTKVQPRTAAYEE